MYVNLLEIFLLFVYFSRKAQLGYAGNVYPQFTFSCAEATIDLAGTPWVCMMFFIKILPQHKHRISIQYNVFFVIIAHQCPQCHCPWVTVLQKRFYYNVFKLAVMRITCGSLLNKTCDFIIWIILLARLCS